MARVKKSPLPPVDFLKASRGSSSAQVGFIFTELCTGLTFALIAGRAKEGKARARNRVHARVAYDSVLRFADRVPMTRKESREALLKLSSLRARLEDLGEKFSPRLNALA